MRVNHPFDTLNRFQLNLDINENNTLGTVQPRLRLLGTEGHTPAEFTTLANNLYKMLDLTINGEVLTKKITANGIVWPYIKEPETIDISLNGKVIGEYVIANGLALSNMEALRLNTSTVKMLAIDNDSNIDLSKLEKAESLLTTDLHTHYAGAPTAESLINICRDHNADYPIWALKKAGVPGLDTISTPTIKLSELTSRQISILKSAMEIPSAIQVTFEELEIIYSLRQPIVKNKKLVPEILEAIAQQCAKTGASYIELSGSNVFDVDEGSPTFLELVHKHMPSIEADTGVKIRFLAACTRKDDHYYMDYQFEKLKALVNDKYIAGVDIVGHETNSTMDFMGSEWDPSPLRKLMSWSVKNKSDWVFRIHAGENQAYPENVRDALQAVVDTASKDMNGNIVSCVQMRIGHGLYGVDSDTIQLMKKTGALVEINASSNLSLNNITDTKEIPLHKYLEADVPIVIGTDGHGIYGTDMQQEAMVIKLLGVNTDGIKHIQSNEQKYLNRRVAIEDRKVNRDFNHGCYSSFDLPPKLTNEKMMSEDKKNQESYLRRRNGLINQLNSIGSAHVNSFEDLPKIFPGLTPILISGASKNNWKLMTDDQKKEASIFVKDLVSTLDPKKVFFITGGTHFGVEALLHEEARSKGFRVLGTLTDDANQDDLKENTITESLIIKGNWWSKRGPLIEYLKHTEHLAIMVAGGAIVGDEIRGFLNSGLRPLLKNGCGFASEDKAKQNPELSINFAHELILSHNSLCIPNVLSISKSKDINIEDQVIIMKTNVYSQEGSFSI